MQEIRGDQSLSNSEKTMGRDRSGPEISIISTMYRSRPFLQRFLAKCLKVLSDIKCTHFEILLVNDGSPDDSLTYLLERRLDIPQLVVVDLSRNFGHHHAIQAGLRHARGDLIFLIDCDLEVSPVVLAEFHRKLRESDCDMVFDYQEARKGGRFEQISGGLFWKGFNFLSDVKIPYNIVTERIMTRRFVDALLQMGDCNLFLAGMMSWTGFNQIGLPVIKKQHYKTIECPRVGLWCRYIAGGPDIYSHSPRLFQTRPFRIIQDSSDNVCIEGLGRLAQPGLIEKRRRASKLFFFLQFFPQNSAGWAAPIKKLI